MAGPTRWEGRVPVPSSGDGEGWELAATVFLPDPEEHPGPLPVLVALPGAGYSRRYFDLPEPAGSQAAHHAARGTAVIAVDHLGAGDSTIPPLEVTTLATVAAAGHAAVTSLVADVTKGTLDPAVGPVAVSSVTGAGQSMGGFVAVAMQAHHHTFDGVAVLGAAMRMTTIPLRPDQPEIVIPEGTPPDEASALIMAATDWRWAFHWEDEPDPLVETDWAAGMPVRHTAPPWGSLDTPGMATTLVLPGVVARETAAIDVPVLVARGERDLCQAPLDELAAFTAATDLAAFTAPRMAHMHNFAATRHLLWDRLDAFIAQVDQSVRARRSG